MGTKIITRDSVVAITAIAISLVAWMAASIGAMSFSSMNR